MIYLSGLCPADRELIGDRMIGSYLTLCPEYVFVCENSLDGSIVGYACSAPDARTFYTRHNVAWLPEMRLKYPQRKKSAPASAAPGVNADEDMLTPIEQMAQSFHSPNSEFSVPSLLIDNSTPDSAQQPWGIAEMYVSAMTEMSLPKRLTMLVLACLRASGTLRVFTEIKDTPNEAKLKDFYASMGFLPTAPAPDSCKEDGLHMPTLMTRCF